MTDDDEGFANGVAQEAKEAVIRTSQRYGRRSVTIVALAAVVVVVSTTTTLTIGLGNRRLQERIKDCSDPGGQCFQRNQQATAKAVQAILDYIDDTMGPHRLRNEAENRCQVELFARKPTILDRGSRPALEEYDDCVSRRSGGTQPPPIPPNPLTTTTTGEKR
jgi:hypothetical protein